jgi:hypothetical protein
LPSSSLDLEQRVWFSRPSGQESFDPASEANRVHLV